MRSSDLHWGISALETSRSHLLSSTGESSLFHEGSWPWLLKSGILYQTGQPRCCLCSLRSCVEALLEENVFFSYHCCYLLKAMYCSRTGALWIPSWISLTHSVSVAVIRIVCSLLSPLSDFVQERGINEFFLSISFFFSSLGPCIGARQ